jgi:uncharacterized protein (TIGR02001 family)
MKKTFLAILATFALSGTAMATQTFENDVEVYGSVGVTTDYVWRGVSQTNEDWVVQSNVGVEYKGFYVEGFASPVKDATGLSNTNWEFDASVGYRFSPVENLTIDGGVITYWYPDSNVDQDFYELQGSVSYDFEKFSVMGAVNYAQDYLGVTDENTFYWSGDANFTPFWDITIGATVGYLDANSDVDMFDWSVYVSKTFAKVFEVKAAYYDNDVDVSFDTLQDIFDNRLVLSAAVLF